jgi:hypothetical protein
MNAFDQMVPFEKPLTGTGNVAGGNERHYLRTLSLSLSLSVILLFFLFMPKSNHIFFFVSYLMAKTRAKRHKLVLLVSKKFDNSHARVLLPNCRFESWQSVLFGISQ